IFPSGAAVVRHVALTLPAGTHQLLIASLPKDTDPGALRVVASDGVALGAVTLTHDRKPALRDMDDPAVKAAKDDVKRLEKALRTKQADVTAIRARADAAGEQLTFLRSLGRVGDTTPADLKALVALVGEQALAAHQAALAATVEADTADRALAPDREALDKARQTLAVLTDGSAEGDVLALAVNAKAAGPATVDITTFTAEAQWFPVYDLFLTRQTGLGLTIDRGVAIVQTSGEDWRGVDLTLSTARPDGQSAASTPSPDLRQIISKEELDRPTTGNDGFGYMAGEPVMEPAPHEAKAAGPVLAYQGATVTYHYPTPVDLRSAAEALRLPLDRLAIKPDLRALAVPLHEETAYIEAEFTNDSGQILLPGPAMLYHDGALAGQGQLPLIAAGAKAKVGFGALDGLRLTRAEPDRSQGQEGILTSSNRLDETAVITVENLTGEDWPVRVIDRVPYSEQEKLAVSYTATPPETAHDEDGKRGILRWDFTLKAGAKQEITLQDSLGWPDGQVLQ
ncbi:MAG: DUF4139 domain-containing protein, partial [Proteobacteria bacterium]|nr:DUF4139 domain-containing protein [Pseudomonadota bacterium]